MAIGVAEIGRSQPRKSENPLEEFPWRRIGP